MSNPKEPELSPVYEVRSPNRGNGSPSRQSSIQTIRPETKRPPRQKPTSNVKKKSIPLGKRFLSSTEKYKKNDAQKALLQHRVSWPVSSIAVQNDTTTTYNVHSAKRFRPEKGRQTIKMSYYTGPSMDDETEYQMRWLHMQRQSMDFDEFVEYAQNAPGIGQDLKKITASVLEEVVEDFQNIFVGGSNIEPGTVVREAPSTLLQENSTVTFVCFPYFSLKPPPITLSSSKSRSLQSMLQVLYPHRFTDDSDAPPSFCRDLPEECNKIMYIPQLWAVVIGSKYIVTCAEASLDDIKGSSIKLERYAVNLDRSIRGDRTDRSGYDHPQQPTSANAIPILRPNATVPQIVEEKSGFTDRNDFRLSSEYNGQLGIVTDQSPIGDHTATADGKSTEKRLSFPKSDVEASGYGISDALDSYRISRQSPSLRGSATSDFNEEKYHDQVAGRCTDHIHLPSSVQDTLIRWRKSHSTLDRDDRRSGSLNRKDDSLRHGSTPHTDQSDDSESEREDNDHHSDAVNPQSLLDVLTYDEQEGLENARQDGFSHIPHIPFFSWAAHTSDPDPTNAEQHLNETLLEILDEVERNIARQRNTPRILQMNLTELEEKLSEMGLQSYFPSEEQPSEKNPNGVPSADKTPVKDPELAPQRPLSSHERTLENLLRSVLHALKKYVRLFIPLDHSHGVAQRFWGACFMVLKDTLQSDLKEAEPESQSVWVVKPFLPGDARKIGQDFDEFLSCTACREGKHYSDREEALDHLMKYHFSRSFSKLTVSASIAKMTLLYGWVKNEAQLRKEIQKKEQIRFLHFCVSHLEFLCQKAMDIHERIMLDDELEPGQHQLPLELLRCFEATLEFIIHLATSIGLINSELGEWKYVEMVHAWHFAGGLIDERFKRLEEHGSRALKAIHRAEDKIQLMSAQELEKQAVNFAPIGPEYLLAVICANLHDKQILDSDTAGISQLCQNSVSHLQWEVTKSPGRRLLWPIQDLREELSVVRKVYEWQQNAYKDYLRVILKRTLEAASSGRSEMIPVEEDVLDNAISQLEYEYAVILDAEEHTEGLRNELRQNIEILEEDHGKAILVFSIVTAVFLPLSFVTSFFGMNTRDIRNSDHGQTFFWTIAIPVTAGVVGLSILIAYRGANIYALLSKACYWLRDERHTIAASMRGKVPEKLPTRQPLKPRGRQASMSVRRRKSGMQQWKPSSRAY